MQRQSTEAFYGVGVDFGTVNSSVAIWRSTTNGISLIADSSGSRVIPSVVAYTKDDLAPSGSTPVAGNLAAHIRDAGFPQCVAGNTKRLIGRPFASVLTDEHVKRGGVRFFQGIRWQQEIVADGLAGGSGLQLPVFDPPRKRAAGARTVPALEACAVVLAQLRELIFVAAPDADFGRNCAVVLSVPAHFDEAQREAVLAAAAIARLPVHAVLLEPAAATLAHCLDTPGRGAGADLAPRAQDVSGTTVVVDLGGGTLDTSVLVREEKGCPPPSAEGDAHLPPEKGALPDDDITRLRVAAVDGDTCLGGEDFTALLVSFVTEELRLKHGLAPHKISSEPRALARLIAECETAKRALSLELQASVELENIVPLAFADAPRALKITRAKLEQVCRDLFLRVTASLERLLKSARLRRTDVSRVVLVGGGSRVPKVRETVETLFGPDVKICASHSFSPEEAVAIGNAFRAAAIQLDVQRRRHFGAAESAQPAAPGEPAATDLLCPSSYVRDLVLQDVVPLSIGVEVAGGLMHPVIRRNTPVPQRSNICSTVAFRAFGENQRSFLIAVYAGERAKTVDCRRLGELQVMDLPRPRRKERHTLTLTFELSATLELNVTARVKGEVAGELKLRCDECFSLPAADLVRMQAAAKHWRASDAEARERNAVLQQLESLLGAGAEGAAAAETACDARAWLEAHREFCSVAEASRWLREVRHARETKFDHQSTSERERCMHEAQCPA